MRLLGGHRVNLLGQVWLVGTGKWGSVSTSWTTQDLSRRGPLDPAEVSWGACMDLSLRRPLDPTWSHWTCLDGDIPIESVSGRYMGGLWRWKPCENRFDYDCGRQVLPSLWNTELFYILFLIIFVFIYFWLIWFCCIAAMVLDLHWVRQMGGISVTETLSHSWFIL